MTNEGDAVKRPDQTRRTTSIVFLLIALALVTLLPAFLFSGVLLLRNNESQREIVRALTEGTTRSLSEAVDREVEGLITTLRVLSTAPSLEQGDLEAFHDRAKQALSGSGSYLLMVDKDYNMVFNTRVDYAQTLPKTADADSARKAFEEDRIVVSPVFLGAVSGLPVFDVLMPVSLNDHDDHVIMLGQNAVDLSNALQTSQYSEGWQAALIDGENNVVATTDKDIEVAKPFFLPYDAGVENDDGWQYTSANGQSYVFVTRKSWLTGWTTVAWAPAEVVSKPLVESMLWLLAGGVLVALIAIGSMSWVSSQIAISVRGLMRDARRLGRGEAVNARTYPVRELAEVSQAIAEASEQRQDSENEIRFLMRELAHRAKNQLSVITAMAKQTAQSSGTIESFLVDFQRRVLGLAKSTDLLLSHGSLGVVLGELVDAHLAPFRPEDSTRLKTHGPQVRLSAEAAQSLGMAFHEMATNASKYGAFKGEGGSLTVSWLWKDDVLLLTWRESGVELAPPNERTGFGTTVIEKLMAATLGADVSKTMHDDGIEWAFSLPRNQILAEPDNRS